MKKFYCLLLAAVLVLTVTCVAVAENSKQGPEIYVDYGFGGTSKMDENYASCDSNYTSYDVGFRPVRTQ